MKRFLQFIFLISLIYLNGCTGFISSDVAVFHILPDTPTSQKYAFFPLEGQEVSLEYQAYKKMISEELEKYQYEEVSIESANVLVAFNYAISSGKEKISSVPTYGQTGVSSSTTLGTINTYGNYSTYFGSTMYTPTYGVTGYRTVSSTEYTRWIWLHIVDKASLDKGDAKRLYEANVVSEGSSSQLAKVIPAMIKAIFKEFPGKSGSTRKEISTLK
ncbi:MAG: DUF4136 domain-containing protein [Phycisphaerales bacterium]|jgi:hypothetical protein